MDVVSGTFAIKAMPVQPHHCILTAVLRIMRMFPSPPAPSIFQKQLSTNATRTGHMEGIGLTARKDVQPLDPAG